MHPSSAFILWIMTIFVTVAIMSVRNEYVRENLGSDGHMCFANKTCRVELSCHVDKAMPYGICLGNP